MTDQTLEPAAAAKPNQGRSILNRLFLTPTGLRREVILIGLLAALFVVIPFFNENFFRLANLRILLLANTHIAILAIGLCMLLIVGEIDLSIGSVMALSGTLTALAMKQFEVAIPLAIVIGLVAAVFVGLINGFFIVKVGVNFLIMTLAMMGILRGLVIVMSEAGVAFLPPAFNRLGQTQLGGLALPVWIMLAIAIVSGFILAKSRPVRQVYFIGSNPKAAELVGIRSDRIRILLYVFCSLLAGVAGILNTARFGSAMPSAGVGVEMAVIAACVLGGSSLSGGQGTVFGALVGVLFLGVISNVLVMLNVATFWHEPINGMVLIFAVTADILARRWRDGHRRRRQLQSG